jgi:hypothetical protein
MMFTTSKSIRFGLLAAALLVLSACASQAPRVSNAALGYAVTTYAVSADKSSQDLSGALGSALNGVGIATAMPAKAEVTIDFVRYDSPVIGLFYGGQHYASMSVTLTDNSGSKISSFPLYVAANGERALADNDLATAAANIIAAKAANAFMPIKAMPKVRAAPVVVEPLLEPADDAAPCVIGPDGRCVVL